MVWMVNPVIPAVIGLGGGAAIGYFVGSTFGAKLPQIIISVSGQEIPGNQIPIGTVYDMKFVNFPPNEQLIAPRDLSVPGGDIVNLGYTDKNGILILTGSVVQGPAGVYYIVAWNATDGKYCAVTTLIAIETA